MLRPEFAPSDLIAAPMQGADDHAPRPAWSIYDRDDVHVADPALRGRYEHERREREQRAAERRAWADEPATACASCGGRVRLAVAVLSPAGAELHPECANLTECAAPVAPPVTSAPATTAPTPAVAAERGAVLVASLPAGAELRRLAAAALLTCTALGAGRYRVAGGREPHTVDLTADGAALPVCTCGDAHWRPALLCKHQLAARAARNAAEDVAIVRAVAVLRTLADRGAVLAAMNHTAPRAGRMVA
jgi:hypothetical protein